MLTEEVIDWLQVLSTLFAFIALILSVVAIYFTIETFRLKRGSFVRGQYRITTSSIATNDPYVHEILLENLKDRSIVIFGIYLQLSSGYYLHLEEFDGEPLVINPFGVIRRKYEPLDGYSFNLKRVKIDDLLTNTRRPKIILSTTDGLIKVKKPVKIKNPMYQWFNNHLIVTVGVDRAIMKGKSYGGAAKYVVSIFNDDDLFEEIVLYGRDHNYKWFKDLGGKVSDLDSVESVKSLFERAIIDKGFKANRVEVVDYQSILNKHYENYTTEPIKAVRHSWLFVHVVGRVLTFLSSRRLKLENKSRQRKTK